MIIRNMYIHIYINNYIEHYLFFTGIYLLVIPSWGFFKRNVSNVVKPIAFLPVPWES